MRSFAGDQFVNVNVWLTNLSFQILNLRFKFSSCGFPTPAPPSHPFPPTPPHSPPNFPPLHLFVNAHMLRSHQTFQSGLDQVLLRIVKPFFSNAVSKVLVLFLHCFCETIFFNAVSKAPVLFLHCFSVALQRLGKGVRSQDSRLFHIRTQLHIFAQIFSDN